MIPSTEQLDALRSMTQEQLVGEVVAARLKQANAELMYRDALAREQSLRTILSETDIITPADMKGRAA